MNTLSFPPYSLHAFTMRHLDIKTSSLFTDNLHREAESVLRSSSSLCEIMTYFYGNWKSITGFKWYRYWSLSAGIQSTASYSVSLLQHQVFYYLPIDLYVSQKAHFIQHISLSLCNIRSSTLHTDYDLLGNFFTFFLKIGHLVKASTRLYIKYWMR